MSDADSSLLYLSLLLTSGSKLWHCKTKSWHCLSSSCVVCLVAVLLLACPGELFLKKCCVWQSTQTNGVSIFLQLLAPVLKVLLGWWLVLRHTHFSSVPSVVLHLKCLDCLLQLGCHCPALTFVTASSILIPSGLLPSLVRMKPGCLKSWPLAI